MADTRYYFASFEVGGEPGLEWMDSNKSFEEIYKDAILDFIKTREPVARYENADWHFGSVQGELDRYYGKFGKVYQDDQMEFDEELGDFIEIDQKASDADYSLFVIDFEHNLVIFSSTHRVRHRNFIKHFKIGFEDTIDGNLEIEFNLLKDRRGLDEIVEGQDVFRFKAELNPTNPGPDDEFRDLDESMQEMLIDRLGIDAQQFDSEGINFEEGFISQVKSMAESEYGETWSVTYEDDLGEIQIVTSENQPERKDTDIDTLDKLRARSGELIDFGTRFL